MYDNEDVCQHFGKKPKTASRMYGDPIEMAIIRKNQFRVLKSLNVLENR